MGNRISDELLAPLASDFDLFARRCLKIRTKSGGLLPLAFNRIQLAIHDKLQRQIKERGRVRALILKYRQGGASTYVEGRFYHRAAFNFGINAKILTHLQEATDNLFGMTVRYHKHCPDGVRPHTKTLSAKELFFDRLDSSFSVSTAGSKDTGRSATAQLFHGSEMAFWDNAVDHMAGIGQIVPNEPGTEIIMETTANGVGNLFHQMWQDASRGLGDYIPIFAPWMLHEDYRLPVPKDFVLDSEEAEYARLYDCSIEQMVWRRGKLISDFRGDSALFDQEYPATPELAFRRVKGDPLINPILVAKARKTPPQEPIGAKIMAVDPAEYGKNATSIGMRQGRTLQKRERYNGLGPMEVVGITAKRFDEWKPDALNIDCTGVGSGVCDRLIELGYPVNRIHFGSRAIEQQIYVLRRDEMWGEMKKWFEDEPCSIPDDDVIAADLSAPQYTYDSSRRLKLESKEQMAKRGIESPDDGDMLALTFAVPVHVVTGRRAVDHGRRSNWRS